MSFKLITILKEALDVSWNPFEESRLTKEKVVDELIKQFNGANLNARWKMIGEYSYEQNVFESLKEVIDELAEEVMSVLEDRESVNEKDPELSDILNIENVSSNPRKPSKYIATIFDFEGDVVDGWTIMPAKKDDEKWKDFYVEALDVSWNPYEESGFKVGDKVKNIVAFWSYLVLDKRQNWKEVEANPIKKSYIPTITDADEEDDMRPWYLLRRIDVTHARPYWEYEEALRLIEPTNEALDVSWNPYQEPANYTNKEYNFIDCDTSSKGPIVSMFFQDENENDLKIEVDTKTRSIIKAQDWGENGDENTLDAKVVKELNQNPYLKRDIDVISKFLFVHMEAIDVSWNPYEDHDYTVMMGKLDGKDAIVRHFTAKDENSALLEFFIEYLGQNTNYAKTAINGLEEKTLLKNSFAYKSKVDDFFWIVAKGDHDQNHMANLGKEYRLKYNI
jgi:hypothetical protein